MLSEYPLPGDTLSEDKLEKDKERKNDYESAKSRIMKPYGPILLDLAIPLPDLYDYSSDKTYYIIDFKDNRNLRIYLSGRDRRRKRKLLSYVYGHKELIALLLAFQISAKEKHDRNPVNKDTFEKMIIKRWTGLEKAWSSFGLVGDMGKFMRSARFRKFYEECDGNRVTLKHPVKKIRVK